MILGHNPTQLFQIGFHLSFLAVIALVWLAPRLVPLRKTDPLTKLIDKSRGSWERGLRSLGRKTLYWCAASLSIWCLTLPIAANGFHLISPIGLVLNVFLWIPVTVALFSGFGTLCLGWISPIGGLLGGVCSTSFVCLESVVKWAEMVPGSYQWVAGPTNATVAFFYGGLSLVLFSSWLRRYSIQWAVVIACASFLLNGFQDRDVAGELRCTFLSVGHGCCVVAELPDGEVWLYDAGSIAGPNFVVDAVSQYLWQRRIGRIDSMIVSHADIDHFNGVPDLLTRFPVGEVVCAPSMLRVDESAVELLKRTIDDADVRLRTVADGETLVPREGLGVRVAVLHPPGEGVDGSDNANSIVLLMDYQGKRILLTGDIEFAGLDRLLKTYQVDVDVAMAPHHGSPRSEPARFVQWCKPEIVVISSGHQRDTKKACALYESVGRTRAYHTSRDGAVSVVVDGAGLRLDSVRNAPSAKFKSIDAAN